MKQLRFVIISDMLDDCKTGPTHWCDNAGRKQKTQNERVSKNQFFSKRRCTKAQKPLI